MKFKPTLLSFAFIGLGFLFLNADQKPKFYFVIDTDTTYCKMLNYETNKSGALTLLEYRDLKGKSTVVEGKEHCPDVATFFMNGVTYDKIPLKPDDKKNTRYTERVVDGKLRVYLAAKGQSDNPNSGTNPSGSYLFYLKTPDGKYYDIMNKDHMAKNIKPFMDECAAFKKQYKGGYSDKQDAFIEAVKLYNTLCN